MKALLVMSLMTTVSHAHATQIRVSSACNEVAQKNSLLASQLIQIQENVNQFDPADSKKGYSLQTGNLLVKMACAPVDLKAGELTDKQIDICQKIKSNLISYAQDSSSGISPETAYILNEMAGGKCF